MTQIGQCLCYQEGSGSSKQKEDSWASHDFVTVMKNPQEVRGLKETEAMKRDEAQRMVVSWESLKLGLRALKETTNTVLSLISNSYLSVIYLLHSTPGAEQEEGENG